MKHPFSIIILLIFFLFSTGNTIGQIELSSWLYIHFYDWSGNDVAQRKSQQEIINTFNQISSEIQLDGERLRESQSKFIALWYRQTEKHSLTDLWSIWSKRLNMKEVPYEFEKVQIGRYWWERSSIEKKITGPHNADAYLQIKLKPGLHSINRTAYTLEPGIAYEYNCIYSNLRSLDPAFVRDRFIIQENFIQNKIEDHASGSDVYFYRSLLLSQYGANNDLSPILSESQPPKEAESLEDNYATISFGSTRRARVYFDGNYIGTVDGVGGGVQDIKVSPGLHQVQYIMRFNNPPKETITRSIRTRAGQSYYIDLTTE